MAILRCVAIDLGAASCRVSLGEWDGAAARIHFLHRYPNGPVEREGRLRWQLEELCRGAQTGLRKAAELVSGDCAIHSIGVDGWAVDYVRLEKSGKPIGDPFCYRDARTESAMPEVWARLSRERIYELTGIQFLRFNTLYQLYADQRDGVKPGAQWLNIPEYLMHWLCGQEAATAVAEYTNSTHTQLVNARTRNWCDEIFQRVGLDRSAAARIVPAGTRLGPLRGELASLPAYHGTMVTAPACHDTGSAVAGIAATGKDWAFISSGTWSLVGAVLDEPCTTAAALRENFTNEGGVGGTYRFLKNVNGMWLLEECLREWQASGHAWSLPKLIAECERMPLPADAGAAIADYCRNARPRAAASGMLFLHARAPYGPLSSSAVGHLVVQACRRAGLPPASAHQLRHAAATAMRRAGAPLSEISQLLRHQHEGTTSKYGTIYPDELGPVTHPWPGEAS